MDAAPNSQGTPDHPPGARSRRSLALELALWVAAWTVARGLLVLSFSDVFVAGEEMEKACAAKAMLDGLGVAHHQLAYQYYEGGGFVISHLDALFFALFGPSLLAVKLVALAFGAAILVAGFGLCRSAGGLLAARVFALLFVLAPESMQKASLLTLGVHFHALLFIALILWATIELAFVRDLRARVWFAWGFCAGFGVYFSYQCAPTVALAGATLVCVLRGALWRRASAWALVGLLLGLVPLLWMFSNVGTAVVDIHGASMVDHTISKLEILKQFLLSIFADRPTLDVCAVAAIVVAPAIGFAALRRTAPALTRAAMCFVLANAALFSVAYVGSGFTIAGVYHYFLLHRLAPLWLFSLFALALGVRAAHDSGRRALRWCACVCVAAPALFGVIDLVRTMQEAAPHDLIEHLVRLHQTKGYAYTSYLPKLAAHLDGSRVDKLRILLRFKEEHPEHLQESLAVALYNESKASLPEIEAELRQAGISDLRGFLLGLGPWIATATKGDIPARIRACEKYAEPERELLIEAVGRNGLESVTEDRVLREGGQGIVAHLPDAYFRGLGHRIYYARGALGARRYFEVRSSPWMLDHERVRARLASCPEPPRNVILQAFEAACIEHSVNMPR